MAVINGRSRKTVSTFVRRSGDIMKFGLPTMSVRHLVYQIAGDPFLPQVASLVGGDTESIPRRYDVSMA